MAAFLRRELVEQLADLFPQGFLGAFLRLAQEAL